MTAHTSPKNLHLQIANSKNPTKRMVANGCFSKLKEVLKSFSLSSILLVLGQKSFSSSPYFPQLEMILSEYRVLKINSVTQNPTYEYLQNQIQQLKHKSYDLVLAIGGGSVLDSSKLYAVVPHQENTELLHFIDAQPEVLKPPKPLIAIPTTSGTGSEVTPFVSIVTRDRKKITLNHPAFYPTIALVDPELSYTMPKYVTASTGFDALSQAIESFWSKQSDPESRVFSLKALELILDSLKKAADEPHDIAARFAMSLGSSDAGIAIARAKTTAVHSVSYPITAHFNVVHGHACALTLSSFLRFNAPVMKESGMPLLKRFNVSSYDSAAKKIDLLMEQTGLERSLTKLGIDEKGIEVIVKDGFRPDRILNNPRSVTADELRKLLKAVL